jgi:hypothetical protein
MLAISSSFQRPGSDACNLDEMLFLSVLDQLNLVPFRSVDECDSTAVGRMRPVRQPITSCRGMRGKLVQVLHFESEVSQIGADYDRSASVEFAYLNFLIAAWCFKKDELRPTAGGMSANLLETQDFLVERDGFLQIVYAISRVQ